MKKNIASQNIGAEMLTAADGTNFTGAVSVFVTLDGGTQTTGAGTAPVHEGNGYHSYTPTQAETNGDHIAYTFTGTGALTATIQVYTTFPQSQDHTVPIDNIDTVMDLIKVDTTAILIDTAEIGTAGAGLTNIGTIATVTNLTNLPVIPTNWITAAGIAAAALNGKGDWNIGKTGYALTQTFPSNFADLAITVTTGQVTAGNMRGTDNALLAASYTVPPTTAAIWAEATRTLTSGANIILTKGVGLTGLNDIAATSIVTGGAITTSAGNASVDVVKINGTAVIGAGTAGNLWRA